MQEQYRKADHERSLHILSSALFTNHPSIPPYVVRDTDSVATVSCGFYSDKCKITIWRDTKPYQSTDVKCRSEWQKLTTVHWGEHKCGWGPCKRLSKAFLPSFLPSSLPSFLPSSLPSEPRHQWLPAEAKRCSSVRLSETDSGANWIMANSYEYNVNNVLQSQVVSAHDMETYGREEG